jgi:hypothetical protein
MFTGLYQRIQIKLWILVIKSKLNVIKSVLEEDKNRVKNMLRNMGLSTPEELVSRLLDFFIIEPVSIEPTDIIKRMDHLLRVTESTFKQVVGRYLPSLGKHERSLAESSLSIVAAIGLIYRVLRHYAIQSEKEENYILLMQLMYLMPQILRVVKTYHEALDSFMYGKPIGDGVGPLVAYTLAEKCNITSRRVVDDTSVLEAVYENRRLIIVKAEGPGSNVGHPGAVISRIVEELGGRVDMILTVDAALKLEGEESGLVTEGVGAAIGDPGPEKIAIERVAAKYNIPLRALVVKMDIREALTTMRRKIYDSVGVVVENIERIIKENVPEGSTLIVAGIGNTMGIPG